MNILIIIDMQNDFVYGSLKNEMAIQIIPKIKAQIPLYDKVIFTKDTHYDNYLNTQEGKKLPIPHCIKKTEGHDIVPELASFANKENCIQKSTFGSLFWEVYLDLDEKDTITLMGVCTDICVITNALILKTLFPENEINVDASCCAGTTKENHEAALKIMQSCQIQITNNE